MSGVYNDWAWKPDTLTNVAIRRGVLKIRAAQINERDNFNAPVKFYGRRVTKKELKQKEKDLEAVREYVARRLKVSISQLTSKGTKMSWATVVLLDAKNTSAFRRYTSLELAVRAAECEPEACKAPDYLVVSAGTPMKHFNDVELAALFKASGGTKKMEREGMETIVKSWLTNLEPEHTELSEEGLKNAAAPDKKALLGEEKPTTTSKEEGASTPKKTNGKKVMEPVVKPAAKKTTGKKTLPPKPAKKRAAAKTSGNGMGREGTLTRFMCDAIVAGKLDDEKILAAARKAFPKNKVGDGYVKWYRNDLTKKGIKF